MTDQEMIHLIESEEARQEELNHILNNDGDLRRVWDVLEHHYPDVSYSERYLLMLILEHVMKRQLLEQLVKSEMLRHRRVALALPQVQCSGIDELHLPCPKCHAVLAMNCSIIGCPNKP
jgi:hypothetical protein